MVYIRLETRESGARSIQQIELGEPTLTATNGTEFKVIGVVIDPDGGNGTVYRAQKLRTDRTVVEECAVKAQRVLTTRRLDRFSNEANIMEMLNHKRVAAIYGKGEHVIGARRFPWYAMPLAGRNLFDHVKEQGPLDAAVVRGVALQLLEALAHIHAVGVLHRDIKPNNFVWQFADRKLNAILMIDFGIAKATDKDIADRLFSDLTADKESVGSQHWFSPELVRYATDKGVAVDHRSDLYQAGKVIWFLATGDYVVGPISSKKDPSPGKWIHKLVTELLHEDVEDRPADAVAAKAMVPEK